MAYNKHITPKKNVTKNPTKEVYDARYYLNWCIKHYKFCGTIISIVCSLLTGAVWLGFKISEISFQIEYNKLIQENNDKLSKQKIEFDQIIQMLSKENRVLEKENIELRTRCLHLELSNNKEKEQ